jgi:HprK-related kinase A
LAVGRLEPDRSVRRISLGTLPPRDLGERMAGQGIAVRIPPIIVRLRSPLQLFAEQFHTLYRNYALADACDFADVDIRMIRVGGARRWARPQVQFIVDGTTPFDPFPIDHAFPMFEWGLNWVFGQRMHSYLLLHAAAVERGGHALLLPAWPGSGKSTLAASLACRGWRLLSDEFGVVKLAEGKGHPTVLPFARPVALKNESIAVMRAFAPDAVFGPIFPKTRKGNVAHLGVPQESVARGSEPAGIGAIVFPDFQSGTSAWVRPLPKATALLKLAGNSFNYEIIGEKGFRTLSAIVTRCESYVLRYGRLADAHAALDEIMSRGRGL